MALCLCIYAFAVSAVFIRLLLRKALLCAPAVGGMSGGGQALLGVPSQGGSRSPFTPWKPSVSHSHRDGQQACQMAEWLCNPVETASSIVSSV